MWRVSLSLALPTHASYQTRRAGFWRGLYAGVGPTVLKGGVNNCIRFSAFNEMKHLYQEYKGENAILLLLFD